MYLKNIILEHTGCLKKINLELPFNNGNPKPVILVGTNGSGKSTLLSYIADAILEMQHRIFRQEGILSPNSDGGYKYFRTAGGYNIAVGQKQSMAYLKFQDDGDKSKIYEYLENIGDIPQEKIKEKTNHICKIETYNGEQKFITRLHKNEEIKKDFYYNSYCYFPANRFEPHYWVNNHYSNNEQLIPKTRYSDQLKKPFILESINESINSWISDVVFDCSVRLYKKNNGKYEPDANLNGYDTIIQTRDNIETILSKILDCDVEIANNYRNNASNFRIRNKQNKEYTILPDIRNLSTGQSVLFNLFCKIIEYSEIENLIKENKDIKGIVVIDEVDLHLHSDLQVNILPKLIKLFPKIQFIVTTHAPLFLLGMNSEFGNDGFQIIDMPEGKEIKIEEFKEFQASFEHYKKSNFFKEEIEKLQKEDKNIIICEGKTDYIHLKKAAEKLNIDLEELNIIFFKDYEKIKKAKKDKGGNITLKNILETFSLRNNGTNKVIGIFDRDTKSILEEHLQYNNEIQPYGNNVFSFCIPEITFKNQEGKEIKNTELEIEHYYPYDIITKTINTAKVNRRLYLGCEFEENLGEKKENKNEIITKVSHYIEKCKNNHIISEAVYIKNDLRKNGLPQATNIALSKSGFADAIKKGIIVTEKEDFKNFDKIFNLIKLCLTERDNEESKEAA